MIEFPAKQPPSHLGWFPFRVPGPAALAEHVLTTGAGRWWADNPDHPRVMAVDCAAHVLLRGDPGALSAADLAPLEGRYVEAPPQFVPVLATSFVRIVPWERMVYVHQAAPVTTPHPVRSVAVRRLSPRDAPALAEVGPDAAWIHASWGGPGGLAGSGYAWGAFQGDRVLAVACTYILGSAYEDVAVLTTHDQRRQHLALNCVLALCADIAARGHTASWSCSRDNRPSRLLAWTAGFRLTREYVHYATGAPVGLGSLTR